MKLKSVFFYQAVKLGSKMINSAHEDHYDISYNDNLVYIYDAKQDIAIAVPSSNIPQMQVDRPADKNPYAQKPMSNIEKARAAKAAKNASLLQEQ